MWVDERGHVLGSVTIGGCVDARVMEESGRVIESGRPALIGMTLGDEDAQALGMTCGGSIEVLIESVDPAASRDPLADALREIESESRAGRRAVLLRLLDDKRSPMLIREDGSTTGSLGSTALDAVSRRLASEALALGSGVQRVAVEDRDYRIYMEVHAPPLTLCIFGATHVAMALVSLGRVLGMRTVVIDGREPFATRERFPDADELIVGMPSEIAERLPLGPLSLVVLLSHDYKYDLPVLRTVLASDASYIGVLGSRRRGTALLDFLGSEGVPGEQLRRVRVPVGLDIGATSAEEIALSVLAEAIAVLRGRGGGPMRDRGGAVRE
jgi:xanthine dehydrogenase accessory factor